MESVINGLFIRHIWFSVSVSKEIVLCNSPWISFTLLNHNHTIYGILHTRKHLPNEVLWIKTMKASSQQTRLVSIFPIWMILKLDSIFFFFYLFFSLFLPHTIFWKLF